MSKNTWEGKHGPLLIAEIGGNHEGDFDLNSISKIDKKKERKNQKDQNMNYSDDDE